MTLSALAGQGKVHCLACAGSLRTCAHQSIHLFASMAFSVCADHGSPCALQASVLHLFVIAHEQAASVEADAAAPS